MWIWVVLFATCGDVLAVMCGCVVWSLMFYVHAMFVCFLGCGVVYCVCTMVLYCVLMYIKGCFGGRCTFVCGWV